MQCLDHRTGNQPSVKVVQGIEMPSGWYRVRKCIILVASTFTEEVRTVYAAKWFEYLAKSSTSHENFKKEKKEKR